MSSLSIARCEAVELFTDRVRSVSPDFAVTDDNAATVTEICQRLLDFMPLSLELAAARVRTLSLDRHPHRPAGPVPDTDGRRAHRRAAPADLARLGRLVACSRPRPRSDRVPSADWRCSRADSTSTPRRPSSPTSTFAKRHQVFDEITLLVDKSLVVSESTSGPTRCRCRRRPCGSTRWRTRRVGRSRCRTASAPPRPLHDDGGGARRPGRRWP